MSDGRQARSKSATMRMFGVVLQAVRRRAGVSREQLAEAAKYSVDMICSVEQGRRQPSIKLIDAAEELCDGGGLLREAAKHIVQNKFPDWFEAYERYEAECAQLGIYENHVIPGLFQTEDYARAVFRSSRPILDEEQIEERVAARMERQRLLERNPIPVISAVIEQVTLERWIGGKEVMRGQLRHLLQVAERRNVDLQVMPTKRETHVGLAGPMYLVETQDEQRLVYFEGQKGSVLHSGSKEVSALNMRYAILRSQALTPEDSVSLVEKMLGEL
ncbi:helix-turn-helix domain-containing protein [Streptomyces hesseae]|uniref:Helix-turn-helix transcriptional regulator n=1 Tax=Streptomyces hesseae TaxID=3075519 RepID=A0ABU2SX76_9ACTN|nr:helix-turn-helix transcriptional regulator [Streptomyces sp. DSM 40473]MDT0453430.1 helix-turn-helix transcriptional regulator [Streptomyces sp. DSM 40473]